MPMSTKVPSSRHRFSKRSLFWLAIALTLALVGMAAGLFGGLVMAGNPIGPLQVSSLLLAIGFVVFAWRNYRNFPVDR